MDACTICFISSSWATEFFKRSLRLLAYHKNLHAEKYVEPSLVSIGPGACIQHTLAGISLPLNESLCRLCVILVHSIMG
jgi:hypothetical protein